MAYATTTDLADYLGVDIQDLPADVERLLERASELIDYVTLGRSAQGGNADALRQAACAQVEMWIDVGEDAAIRGPVQSFSLGRWSVVYGIRAGTNQNTQPELASRARQALALAGLLYRGVAMV